jgi:uncharacterized membrane protein
MSTALTAAVGGGFISALMYLSVLSGSLGGVILVYLAPLPLFAAGLAVGRSGALVAGVTAAVLVAGFSGSLVLIVTYLVFSVVPTLVMVRQGLLSRLAADGTTEWYPPGRLLMILAGLGAAGLGLATVAALGEANGLRGVVQEMLGTSLNSVLPPDPVGGPAGSPALEGVTAVFPGVVAVSWLLMIVINGLLAQGAVGHFQHLVRPPLVMAEIELPPWAALVFALTVLGAVMLSDGAGYLLTNLALVLSVPFFFAGLAVVHAFARARQAKAGMLVMFYLVLSVFAWPVLAVVGLGIIEQWVGLRRRIAATARKKGEA